MVPNLRVLVLHQTLQLYKFEGVDFKYGNRFFQILPQNLPIEVFLVLNLRIFIFAGNFPFRKIWGTSDLISDVKMAFSNSNAKILKKSHLCRKCKHFCFCMKFHILKNSRILALKIAIVFSHPCLKIPKNTTFSVKNQSKSFFFLLETLCELNFT